MPRRPRVRVAGVPHHLIQRGVNRSTCFFADDDRIYFLDQLERLAGKCDVAVHAYVLMTNHIHLLATPRIESGVSDLMKHLGQCYVQYVNRHYRRTGSLWEGRFRSCLVGGESYYFACQRYIELNPVRARMVSHPQMYRWSSYRSNALGHACGLIRPHAHYLALGSTETQRAAAYAELFHEVLDVKTVDDIRSNTNGGYCFGDGRFAREIEIMTGRRVARGKPGRPRNPVDADNDQLELDRP